MKNFIKSYLLICIILSFSTLSLYSRTSIQDTVQNILEDTLDATLSDKNAVAIECEEDINFFDDADIDSLPKPDFTPPSMMIQYAQQAGLFILCSYIHSHESLVNIYSKAIRTLKLRRYNP